MASGTADLNLLFGILALQMDFVTRDALIAAMHAWAMEKHRSLGEILVERGAIDPVHRDAMLAMLDCHVAKHGGDPAASLAALSSAHEIASDLRRSVGDPEVLVSLAHVPPASRDDPYATRSTLPTESSSVRPRYHRVRSHARGGLGVVFVARDAELNREVALKEMQDSHADEPASRDRFLAEAEVTGGLEHPGIVPVYGLGTYEDGRPFYAMRFIRGDSFRQAIASFHRDSTLRDHPGARTLLLQKLLRRFLDVCNAVDYAHSRGVLHRDLKPDNIMVGRFGETLVVDWGLAKSIGRTGGDGDGLLPEMMLRPASAGDSERTMPGSVVGTPAYMSPEQAEGRIDLLGPASDVYSLGGTLYSLLTGSPPVAGADLSDVLARVRSGDFPRPREECRWLDPALEAICLKAMSLRPIDRYASPRDLAFDIERWLADEPTSAYREGIIGRSRRLIRRHPMLALWLLVSAAVDLLLIMIAFVILYQLRYATSYPDRNSADRNSAFETLQFASRVAPLLMAAPMLILIASQIAAAVGSVLGLIVIMLKGRGGASVLTGLKLGALWGIMVAGPVFLVLTAGAMIYSKLLDGQLILLVTLIIAFAVILGRLARHLRAKS
jgi:serine/threonine protein kinase